VTAKTSTFWQERKDSALLPHLPRRIDEKRNRSLHGQVPRFPTQNQARLLLIGLFPAPKTANYLCRGRISGGQPSSKQPLFERPTFDALLSSLAESYIAPCAFDLTALAPATPTTFPTILPSS
jgi:hypothetical protein